MQSAGKEHGVRGAAVGLMPNSHSMRICNSYPHKGLQDPEYRTEGKSYLVLVWNTLATNRLWGCGKMQHGVGNTPLPQNMRPHFLLCVPWGKLRLGAEHVGALELERKVEESVI